MTSSPAEASGTLKQHPLARLVYYLYTKQYTGIMRIGAPQASNLIYLRDGSPVAAEITERTDPMVELLVRMRVLPESAVHQVLIEMARSGKSEYDIIRGLGAAEEQVDKAYRQMLLKRLCRLFRILDAPFSIHRQDHTHAPTPDLVQRLRVHPRTVVYHGIRNAYDLDRIAKEMGTGLQGKQFRIDPQKAGHLERYQFDQDDQILLESMRTGYWTVSTLAQQTGRGELEVSMMAYALLLTDLLDMQAVGSQASRLPTAVPSPASAIPIATPRPAGMRSGTRPGGTRPPAHRMAGAGDRPRQQTPAFEPRQYQPTPVAGFSARIDRETTRPGVGSGTVPPVGRSPGTIPPRSTRAPGSNTPHTQALTPEGTALKRSIEEKLGHLDQLNYFDLLGVGQDAAKEVIKSAYLNLAKTFHPDRLAPFRLESMRPEVEKLFARISEAQAVLLDDTKRLEYQANLRGVGKVSVDDKARKILDAETAFQRGEIALRGKHYAEAEAFFRNAAELNPEEGEHLALLGWTMYNNPAHVRSAIAESAKQQLFRAVKMSRNNPRPYYLLGEVYLAENDLERAISQFRKALELRENHVEAQRGMRLAQMRKEKDDEKKGGLFGRFKKK